MQTLTQTPLVRLRPGPRTSLILIVKSPTAHQFIHRRRVVDPARLEWTEDGTVILDGVEELALDDPQKRFPSPGRYYYRPVTRGHHTPRKGAVVFSGIISLKGGLP